MASYRKSRRTHKKMAVRSKKTKRVSKHKSKSMKRSNKRRSNKRRSNRRHKGGAPLTPLQPSEIQALSASS